MPRFSKHKRNNSQTDILKSAGAPIHQACEIAPHSEIQYLLPCKDVCFVTRYADFAQ